MQPDMNCTPVLFERGCFGVFERFNYLSSHDFKFSVDTEEDYQEIKRRFESKKRKEKLAIAKGWGVYEY